MAQCVSSPTRTSSVVGTTRVVSTTLSRFLTTPPGSVSTSFFTTCSTASNSTICATSTNVVTQTGTPFTTTDQVVVTVDVPYTSRAILYGSCTTVPGVVVSPTISSPVVSTVTSSSVYTSDGSTYITVVTSLSSADPPESTSSDSPSPPSSNSNDTTNKHIPAIVGGAVGGIVVLALLAYVAWKFFKKPPISFDKEDFSNFHDPTKQEQGSSPYHYTPVGQQESQTVGQAFPNDTGPQPTLYGNDTAAFSNGGVTGGDTFTQSTGPTNNGVGPTTTTGNETALQPGILGNDVMYNVPNHGPVHQMPMSSLAAGSAAIAAAGPAARPNSTYSSTAYMPGSDPSSQQMYYPPNLGYAPQQYPTHPSVLAPYPQQQPYGPPPMQHQTQRPLSHHLSVGSTMTMTTSSGIGSSTGPGDVMPSLMVQPGQVYTHHQQSFGQQSYGDSLTGSQSVGSAGPPESQVLQVRNPGSDSFVQDSSTTVGTPGVVVGPPPSTSSPPPIDGKGRPLDTRGEKTAMVHLDGGAYGASSTPAPPAYRE